MTFIRAKRGFFSGELFINGQDLKEYLESGFSKGRDPVLLQEIIDVIDTLDKL